MDDNCFVVIEKLMENARNMGIAFDEPHTLNGTSLVDGSGFVRIFPDSASMKLWLTSFEATQYDFS